MRLERKFSPDLVLQVAPFSQMLASFGDWQTLLHSDLVVLNETVTAPGLSAVVLRDSKAFASEVKLESL